MAMLGKQGWRLEANHDTKLVSKVFKARYFQEGISWMQNWVKLELCIAYYPRFTGISQRRTHMEIGR